MADFRPRPERQRWETFREDFVMIGSEPESREVTNSYFYETTIYVDTDYDDPTEENPDG